MKIKKRHVVLAVLVLALSSAVFINWQLSDVSGTDNSPVARELGAVSYVNSAYSSSADEMQVSADADASLTKEQIEYFAAAKTERQRVQDEVKTMAMQVLELSDSSDEAKEEAVEQLNKLEQAFLSQSRIESTLKAKGFSECLCTLSDNSCTVVVPENELDDSTALIIKACVDEVADLPFENISIVGA